MTLREFIINESLNPKMDKILGRFEKKPLNPKIEKKEENKYYKVFNDDLGDVITKNGKKPAIFPSMKDAVEKTLKLCRDYYESNRIEFHPLYSDKNETTYGIFLDRQYHHTDIVITHVDASKATPNSNQELMFEIEAD